MSLIEVQIKRIHLKTLTVYIKILTQINYHLVTEMRVGFGLDEVIRAMEKAKTKLFKEVG